MNQQQITNAKKILTDALDVATEEIVNECLVDIYWHENTTSRMADVCLAILQACEETLQEQEDNSI